MFRINMLPADHGDCLWVEYGKKDDVNRFLIDGGTQHSFGFLSEKIKRLSKNLIVFDLFVVTHVDADHIGGALELLRQFEELGKTVLFKDIWFNGWKHLSGDKLGDLQGELITDHLVRRKLPWNRAVGEGPVMVQNQRELPVVTLDTGLRLTILSPSRSKLDKIRDRWENTITKEKLELGNVRDKDEYFQKPADLLGDVLPDINALAAKRFTPDKTPANGSTIAFLAEYHDGERSKRCLFTGDAHVDQLINSIELLIDANHDCVENGRLKLDALKLSHHGSKNNVSKQLLEMIDCSKYLISTNGQQFSHPDREAIARVIKYGRARDSQKLILFFNYESDFNRVWAEPELQSNFEYRTEYPATDLNGIAVEL